MKGINNITFYFPCILTNINKLLTNTALLNKPGPWDRVCQFSILVNAHCLNERKNVYIK